MDEACITKDKAERYKAGLANLIENTPEFRSSIESTTKSMENYRIRFSM